MSRGGFDDKLLLLLAVWPQCRDRAGAWCQDHARFGAQDWATAAALASAAAVVVRQPLGTPLMQLCKQG